MKYFSKNNFTTKELKTIVLTLMLVFFCTSIFAQRGVRIGYIDTEYILENITEYQNAQSQLEIKVQQWKTEVEQRIAELETQKTQLNKLLMSAILGVGDKINDGHRPEPLIYDPHSFDSEKQLKNRFGDENLPTRQHSRIKRMYACCSSAQFLIQSAQERNQSWLPLQISLVLVDMVVKIRYLAAFAEKMAKKKHIRKPISDADAANIYQGIVAGFNQGEKSLRSFEYRKESPLYQWILNIAKKLQEMPLQDIKIETITQFCQNVVCVSEGANSQGGIKLHHLHISEDGMFERGENNVEYCSGYDNKWTPYAKTPGEGKFRA